MASYPREKCKLIYYLITMIRKYCSVKGNNTKLVKHVENNSSINIGYIGYYLKRKKFGTTKPLLNYRLQHI